MTDPIISREEEVRHCTYIIFSLEDLILKRLDLLVLFSLFKFIHEKKSRYG